MKTLATVLLSNQEVRKRAEGGVVQCDPHMRDANERRVQEDIEARTHLVMRFLPFIWLQDQNMEPVELMETVAVRLYKAADAEKKRRLAS